MRNNNLTKRSVGKIINVLLNNTVPIVILLILVFAIPLSNLSGTFIIREIVTRLSRNLFLILSLIIPVLAGMGMNFSIVLGAMSAQIAIIFITDWGIIGIQGVLLAILISTPIAILLGFFAGIILNKAKGKEMVTGFMLSFFVNGIYQIFVLFIMGSLIPISNSEILLDKGYGIRNTINLIGIRQVLDNLIAFDIKGVRIPILLFLIIGLLCIFIIWFKKTKLGHEINTVGQDNDISAYMGINVGKIRILSIVISTILACYGQIIFLQNIGTLTVYDSHIQVGVFTIAAILVGGASVTSANIGNAIIGAILFHAMFVVSPLAGKTLIGNAQIGEYFRVFISYGVIAFSLAVYAWRERIEEKRDEITKGNEI